MQQWYVVQVLSGHEKKVKRVLEENISTRGYSDLIEEILVPVEQVSEVKQGKQRIVEKKLWPGYFLLKADLTDEVWTFIKSTDGVIGVLGDSTPTPLTDFEINEILNDLKSKTDTIQQKHQFEVGRIVKIVDGVFENFSGEVLEIFQEKGTVSVMVSIFGRDTRVDDLEFWQIEVAEVG